MKIIKKSLTALVLALFVSVSAGSTFTANADFLDDAGDFFSDLFSSGDETGLSFTSYEGQLGELSKDGYDASLTENDNIRDFIVRVVNFALGFLGLIAVIVVIYGGVLYVTAGGEEERTQKGKRSIMYATIGLLIVLGSYAFVNTVIKAPTGGSAGDGTTVAGGTAGPNSESRGPGTFNAAASQVRAIASDIYNGFVFIAESTEDFKDIRSDSQKSTLYFANKPKRAEMITFLNSAKTKLQKVGNKVQNLSIAEARVNEQVRRIDKAIDIISVVTGGRQFLKTDFPDIDICHNSDSDCKDDGYPYYESGLKLLHYWQVVHRYFCDDSRSTKIFYEDLYDCTTKIEYTPSGTPYAVRECTYVGPEITDIDFESPGPCTPGEPDINSGTDPAMALNINIYLTIVDLGINYQAELLENINQLEGIWEYLSVIDAVKDGKAAEYYNAMMDNYKLFYNSLDDWQLNVNISSVAEYLLEAMRNHALFYDEILKIDFVDARLTANITEGNAPLAVVFDTFRTEDPAGGSVQGDSIVWDLAGIRKVDELYVDAPHLFLPATDVMVCNYSSSSATDIEDLIGETAQRCLFKKPGSYEAAVLIHSNDPTKYGPGLSIIPIKVNPPATEINLSVEAGSSGPIWVNRYINNQLSTDRSQVTFTLDDASASPGIEFNAATTDAESFKWDLGDGTIVDFGPQDTVTHTYDQTGRYTVTLEVENALGEVDRKVFTLNVDNVAARITANPQNNAFINKPVTFDGSSSRSDVGSIRQYEWKIIEDDGTGTSFGDPALVEDSGSNLRTLTHEFDDPGRYDVYLRVTNDADDTSMAILDDYLVQSQEPVAQFTYDIPNENQPASVYLDASTSFDPDGANPDLTYDWSIDPPSTSGSWEWEVDPATDPVRPVIKFLEKGEYKVTLQVLDAGTIGFPVEEKDTITKTITVNDVLDVAWADGQPTTAVLNANGEADFGFSFVSENAVAYQIKFGDGDQAAGELFEFGSETHTYDQADQFDVELTVFDDEDNDKTIRKRVFIGDGNSPLAQARVLVNEVDVTDFYDGSDPIEVTKNDILKFDATESVNVDGTGRNLRYSWDFGDTGKSSDKIATHRYKELSPEDPGYFDVVLRVSDREDPTLNDVTKIRVKVVSSPPRFSAIQALPTINDSDLVTPVTMKLQAFNAEDLDGEITQYRWWYYDVDEPDEPLGIQITESPSAQLVVGTNGKEGKEKTYGFALEIRDSDNLKFSSEDLYDSDTAPSVTVINGANDLPTAKFNVDNTTVFAGEKVRFTSASTDSDGKIVQYIWDLEGDGFFNNEPVEFSTIEHTYTEKNTNGYDVRLKVVDNYGGESISDPVTIFVDSLAEAPTAAFKFKVVAGSDGKEIQFINNSSADKAAGAEIIQYKWDFDAAKNDSDGDGVADNDSDSKAAEPSHTYNKLGSYQVKLTVTDNQGNTDSVTNTITIPLANPPKAAFTYDFVDGKLVFKNNSTADFANGAKIEQYIWDFDTNSKLVTADSDGDGTKDNDVDSVLKNPVYEYKQSGTYQVKLTVIDNQGNQDEVTNPISVQVVGGSSGGGGGSSDLEAVVSSSPAAGADGVIYLSGTSGFITFNFAGSKGPIATYSIDKNIYFDTDGNGIKNDDNDFKTALPGTWKTNFDKSWGKTVVKITVTDIYGNTDDVTLEVKFK